MRDAVELLADEKGIAIQPLGEESTASPLDLARRTGLHGKALSRKLAELLGIPFLTSTDGFLPSAEFVDTIPIAFARHHGIIGFEGKNGGLTIALSDVSSWEVLDVLVRLFPRPLSPVVASPALVHSAINGAYEQREGQAGALIEKLDDHVVLEASPPLAEREDLLDVARRAPVIQLVNLLLFEAVKLSASDIHIQPYEGRVMVRMRMDGVLYDLFELPQGVQEELVSRVKVMGRMNIAEKRLAQDGRATVQLGERIIDLRIASLPTSFGERVVIRLLDKSARLYTLEELGMATETMVEFRDLIQLEHGIILVTGPTGSGKTTTLYAALQEINKKERNMLTLEDPIEYQLEGISQTQVNEKKGMTFAGGLRSVLRQDPDIIMVGEIRDKDTAAMAIQSALTGHLVFSTVHTNDAASTVTRLLDLGVEPYLVASSVVGVLAQRLVRRVCKNCAEPITPSPRDLQTLGLDPNKIDAARYVRGPGCDPCRRTGFRGRIGLFEWLKVTESIRRLISARATASEIKQDAVRNGMKTLRDDGISKILSGITTPDEVLRVTMREES